MTGVQTCALPICENPSGSSLRGCFAPLHQDAPLLDLGPKGRGPLGRYFFWLFRLRCRWRPDWRGLIQDVEEGFPVCRATSAWCFSAWCRGFPRVRAVRRFVPDRLPCPCAARHENNRARFCCRPVAPSLLLPLSTRPHVVSHHLNVR